MYSIENYPRFAKNGILTIFGVALCAGLFLVVSNMLGLPENGAQRAAMLTLLVLALPIMAAIPYFFDPADYEAAKIGFVDDEVLRQKIEPLLARANCTSVRVGYFQSEIRNAFAISNFFGRNSLIAFTTGLISVATDKQLSAIAAHEIAHLKNGDARSKSYILSFNKALQTYPYLLAEFGKVALNAIVKTALLAALAMGAIMAISQGIPHAIDAVGQMLWMGIQMGFWPAAAVLVFLGLDHVLARALFAHSRAREFVADADGAAMTSAADMKSALELLTDPGTEVSVFDTHPPLAERTKRLGDLEKI